MKNIVLKSLPKVLFAHNCNTSVYNKTLVIRKQFIEIGYVASGEFQLSNAHGCITAQKDDIYIISPTIPTSSKSITPSEHHTVGIYVDNDLVNVSTLELIKKPRLGMHIKPLIDELIIHFQMYPRPNTKSYALACSLIDYICLALNEDTDAAEPTGELMYVNKIKLYISQNITKPIRLQDIADRLHLSVSYVCIIFKKITGQSVISYINNSKVDLLKSLMLHRGLSLKEACSHVGISDPSYASKLFKKIHKSSVRSYKSSTR